MTSRKGAIILGLVMLAGATTIAIAGAIGGTDAGVPSPNAFAANNNLTVYKVDRRHATNPIRDDEEFDRGVWCTYKKVNIYDKYHHENYLIDRKVCLGAIE